MALLRPDYAQAYDSIIFISDEIRYIWMQTWSFGKVLYLIARYSCFIDAVAVVWFEFTTSQASQTCRTAFTLSNLLPIEKRGGVLWDDSLSMNAIVLAYLLLIQSAGAVIGAFEINKSIKTATLTELNVVILSLIRGISQWRKESSQLVHTLYRDGVLYFAILSSITFLNVIFMLKFTNTPLYYTVMLYSGESQCPRYTPSSSSIIPDPERTIRCKGRCQIDFAEKYFVEGLTACWDPYICHVSRKDLDFLVMGNRALDARAARLFVEYLNGQTFDAAKSSTSLNSSPSDKESDPLVL
ncbi:hypothetical protein SCHPADRAFT_892336 [Schizopora paradoxa]|uniref:DUF6533 domain-containing protein n=1 Tax=Schizopora paradoxa TaxID=27342 RepID=A0A0H2RF21_9AGAM|nr:hypothetical protein SCHPADRAFT_892336 [Schizopora paradoxa]